ncbi:hypothetical protein NMY22_g9140 [Coprinellus aureogranulatus]|nr:hypothetical protein NMY22_g9140 [Coprinellus aureogranulatus]
MELDNPPIQRLPAEILTQIFLDRIPSPSRGKGASRISASHPATIFSHVCHDWRELALGTPLLWSGIYIQIPPSAGSVMDIGKFHSKAKHQLAAIEAWLQRSGGSPLTITLDIRAVSTFNDQGYYEAFKSYQRPLKKLFRCSRRWRSVDIDVDATDMAMRSVIDGVPSSGEDFPVLTSLHLQVTPDRRYESPELTNLPYSDLLRSAVFSGPALREVKVEGHFSSHNFRDSIPGWSSSVNQLTLVPLWVGRLPLEAFAALYDSADVILALEALPHLEIGSFFLQHPGPGRRRNPPDPKDFPDLKFLSLSGRPVGEAFAQSLILPSLNELSLLFHTHGRPEDGCPRFPPPAEHGSGALALVRIFGGQFTSLTLNPDIFTPTTFPFCLRSLDNDRLECLSLINECFPSPEHDYYLASSNSTTHEAFDYATIVYLSNPSSFPNLRRLEMYIRNPSEAGRNEEAVVELLAARMKDPEPSRSSLEGKVQSILPLQPLSTRCLRHAHITFSHRSRVDISQELRRRSIDLAGQPFSMRLRYSPFGTRKRVL